MQGIMASPPKDQHGKEQQKEAAFDLDAAAFSSDEFRMYQLKVKRCPRARPHDWTACPFAHAGEKAKRRDPRKYRYSGTACPEFRRNGCCRRADNCPFAHGVFECWLHPSRYRTQMCTDGTACRRRVCFFAHVPEELRKPEEDPAWLQQLQQQEMAAEQQMQQQAQALKVLSNLQQAMGSAPGAEMLRNLPPSSLAALMSLAGGGAASPAAHGHSPQQQAAPGGNPAALLQLLAQAQQQQAAAAASPQQMQQQQLAALAGSLLGGNPAAAAAAAGMMDPSGSPGGAGGMPELQMRLMQQLMQQQQQQARGQDPLQARLTQLQKLNMADQQQQQQQQQLKSNAALEVLSLLAANAAQQQQQQQQADRTPTHAAAALQQLGLGSQQLGLTDSSGSPGGDAMALLAAALNGNMGQQHVAHDMQGAGRPGSSLSPNSIESYPSSEQASGAVDHAIAALLHQSMQQSPASPAVNAQAAAMASITSLLSQLQMGAAAEQMQAAAAAAADAAGGEAHTPSHRQQQQQQQHMLLGTPTAGGGADGGHSHGHSAGGSAGGSPGIDSPHVGMPAAGPNGHEERLSAVQRNGSFGPASSSRGPDGSPQRQQQLVQQQLFMVAQHQHQHQQHQQHQAAPALPPGAAGQQELVAKMLAEMAAAKQAQLGSPDLLKLLMGSLTALSGKAGGGGGAGGSADQGISSPALSAAYGSGAGEDIMAGQASAFDRMLSELPHALGEGSSGHEAGRGQ